MAPQFKKLTDCPENLREAIDWLIQVRHGGDGQGLKRLAEALKRLIEEAIKKAEESFKRRENQLSCPEKYYTNPDVSYCNKQNEEINKLKPDRNSTTSENDPALLKLESDLKKHLDEDHYLSKDARRNALKDIAERREQVADLKNKLIGFTDTKKCNELLTNLCTGLETFLGFDSASKGYNGTGIVYSDLDRLCDGVMAFLYQLLKDVKENINLTPYQTTLNNAVTQLNRNLSKGKKGLNAVIETVKQGIEEWLVDMEKKINEVTKFINVIYKDRIPALANTIKSFNDQEYDINTSDLQKWIESANNLPNYSGMSIVALRYIDDNLDRRLRPSVNLIHNAVQTFVSSAKKDRKGLQELRNKVGEQFRDMNEKVKNDLNNTVKKAIDKDVKGIKNNVSTKYPKPLEANIKNATQTLRQARDVAEAYLTVFTGNKRDKFGLKFENITKLLDNVNKKDSKGILKSQLKIDVEGIQQHIGALDAELNACANKIGGVINSAVSGVITALAQLDEKVQADIVALKKKIDRPIDDYVKVLNAGLRQAVLKGGDTHMLFPQEFSQGLGGRSGEAPQLYQWVEEKKVELQGALEALDRDGKFNQVIGFLKQFMDMNDKRQKTFFGAIGAEITGIVKRVIFNLDDANSDNIVVKNLMVNYIKWVTQNSGDPNSLHSRVKNIKPGLADFFKDGDVNETSIFNIEEVGAFHTYHVTKEKAKTAMQELHEKINKLEDLPETVKQARSSVDMFIDEIKEKFEYIHKQSGQALEFVTTAGEQLPHMIQNIGKEIDEVHRKAKQYIQNFYDEYKQKSGQIQQSIKNESLKQFAISNDVRLERLRELVSEQLKEVKDTIAADLTNGVKGMMGRMKHVLLDDVKNLASIGDVYTPSSSRAKSQVSQAAEYLRKSITNLLMSLAMQDEVQQYNEHINKLSTYFDTFFNQVISSQHFSNEVSTMRLEFENALHVFYAETFPDTSKEVLLPLKHGFKDFVQELKRVYVSAYSGQQWEPDNSEKYAKVSLTIISTLFTKFSELREICKDDSEYGCKLKTIYHSNWDSDLNPLGHFLERCGFIVPTAYLKNDGELRNNPECKGNEIYDIITNKNIIKDDDQNADAMRDHSSLKNLYNYLNIYYSVCHLRYIESAKLPCDIFQMLSWLCSLWHNPVRASLSSYFKEFFDKKTQTLHVAVPTSLKSVVGYTVQASDLTSALFDVCHHSHSILTAIMGHGHSGGTYACDFSSNSLSLLYPTDMITLLCLLVDILKRLHLQLYFLYQQCLHNSSLSGWNDCYYGKGVGGSTWQCNGLQCIECTTATKCMSHPTCGLKSPLQSFLEDGLQGFLPHDVSSKGTKFVCSNCSNASPGIPCKTPMGFHEISTIASHTQMGKHIYIALSEFCSGEWSPLSRLCSLFNCIIPSAPKTLDELFSFYYNLLSGWNDTNTKLKEHREMAFNSAVVKANFENINTQLDITSMFGNSNHGTGKNMPHLTGDMYSLVSCNPSSAAAHPCGPYLKPLCLDIYCIFSKDNADRYLSWVVYITEKFYHLLQQLYNACHSTCGSEYSKCRTTQCVPNCRAAKLPMSPESSHHKSCNTIVKCKYTRPTIYKYGFTHEDMLSLSGRKTKRTCKDFCMVLGHLFKTKTMDDVLTAIDNFLLAIRFPFMSLTLTLWLLSFLYLIHILVIRLDLLHIKSHLHSPSSHRIAAQSLLAAARVGKLSKISYLQP